SFNVVKATLTVSGAVPLLTAPLAGLALTPGQTVTALSTRDDVTWSIGRPGDGLPPFASGSGSSLAFTVPADSTPDPFIRITMSGSTGAQVYRDFPIFVPSAPIAYWKLDEGAGTVAADASGYGNGGTLVNSPVWVAGRFTRAQKFTGTHSHAISQAGSLTDSAANGMSI